MTVTDANGCTVTGPCDTLAECNISVLGSITQPTCPGSCDGSIVLTTNASNPSFVWSITTTTSSIFGLCAGTYCVTVTDGANGCEFDTCFTIVDPPQFVVSSLVTPVSCSGLCDGQIDMMVTGAANPINYSIDNCIALQLSNNFNNLCPGTYDFCMVDANGCTYSELITVTEPTHWYFL